MSCVVLVACDRGSPDTLPGPQGPPLHLVASSPPDGALDAPLDGVIRLRFDRFLDPRSPVRQSIVLTAGGLDRANEAPAGELFTSPTYDVVERVVVFRAGQLTPGVRYTLLLRKPADFEGTGFRACDGAELASTLVLGFTTTTNTAAPSAELPEPQGAYCDTCQQGARVPGAASVLAASCAGCHAASAPGGAPHGLDLSSPEALRATAISRPARQTLTGLTTGAQVRPLLFGSSMPIVDPDQPGNSYLVFKVLVDDALFARPGPPTAAFSRSQPVPGPLAPSPDETARLREAFVAGHPMPLGSSTFDLVAARTLQAWVAAGAPTDDACPAITDCAAP